MEQDVVVFSLRFYKFITFILNYSQQDIENFRAEFERRQLKDSDSSKKSVDTDESNLSEVVEMTSSIAPR